MLQLLPRDILGAVREYLPYRDRILLKLLNHTICLKVEGLLNREALRKESLQFYYEEWCCLNCKIIESSDARFYTPTSGVKYLGVYTVDEYFKFELACLNSKKRILIYTHGFHYTFVEDPNEQEKVLIQLQLKSLFFFLNMLVHKNKIPLKKKVQLDIYIHQVLYFHYVVEASSILSFLKLGESSFENLYYTLKVQEDLEVDACSETCSWHLSKIQDKLPLFLQEKLLVERDPHSTTIKHTIGNLEVTAVIFTNGRKSNISCSMISNSAMYTIPYDKLEIISMLPSMEEIYTIILFIIATMKHENCTKMSFILYICDICYEWNLNDSIQQVIDFSNEAQKQFTLEELFKKIWIQTEKVKVYCQKRFFTIE